MLPNKREAEVGGTSDDRNEPQAADQKFSDTDQTLVGDGDLSGGSDQSEAAEPETDTRLKVESLMKEFSVRNEFIMPFCDSNGHQTHHEVTIDSTHKVWMDVTGLSDLELRVGPVEVMRKLYFALIQELLKKLENESPSLGAYMFPSPVGEGLWEIFPCLESNQWTRRIREVKRHVSPRGSRGNVAE